MTRQAMLAGVAAAAVLVGAGSCRPAPAPRAAGLTLGPVLGSPSPQRIAIWLQGSSTAVARVDAWPEGSPSTVIRSASTRLEERDGWRATLGLEGLAAGTRYRYRVLLDGVEVAGGASFHFRTPPEQGVGDHLRIAVGSCAALWRRPDTGVWRDIGSAAPDLVVALGDTPYADHGFTDLGDAWKRARVALARNPADPGLRAGLEAAAGALVEAGRTRIPAAYGAFRRAPGFAELARGAFWVATWDDHDTGIDNGDAENPLRPIALDVFRSFTPNPSFGLEDGPGTFFDLHWGDVDLVLLDDSSFRMPTEQARRDPSAATMLGERQLEWLLERLGAGEPTFTLLASGSPFNDFSRKDDAWVEYPRERNLLLDAVAARRMDGLVLLSGDVHRTELHRLPWLLDRGGYPLWEVVSSPLVNSARGCGPDVAYRELCEGSALRHVRELWVLLDIDTTLGDPRIVIEVHEVGRGVLHRRVLLASQLRFGD